MAIKFSEKITFLPSKKTGKPFSPEQELEIIKVIQDAYDLSPTYNGLPERNNRDNAIDMLEYWVSPPPYGLGRKIIIQFLEGGFQASTNEKDKGLISIDPDYVKKGSYIGLNGTAILSTFKDGLIHELGHALRYYQDDWRNYQGNPNPNNPTNIRDYSGRNVTYINNIYKELGIPLQRSYPAADYTEKIIKPGYEYTNGTKIDAALALGTKELPTKTFWNSTQLGNSNDLLIGGLSSDTLISGPGNDFLFGSLGNDTLDGGEGSSDTGVYYGFRKNYCINQAANGDWIVQGITGLGKTAGKDTLKNIEFLQFDDPDPDQPGKKKTWELKPGAFNCTQDIALVFDTTGSNGKQIAYLKSIAKTIVTVASGHTSDGVTSTSNPIDFTAFDEHSDTRFAIIGFKDTQNAEPSKVFLPFTEQDDFADREAAVIAALDSMVDISGYGYGVNEYYSPLGERPPITPPANSIIFGGGGDKAETPFDGLRLALNGSIGEWRYGAGTCQILVTAS
jgi:RTX calcium-binding nonapeptide repeat (4 copies)